MRRVLVTLTARGYIKRVQTPALSAPRTAAGAA